MTRLRAYRRLARLTPFPGDGMMPPREGPPMERRRCCLSRRQFVVGTGSVGLGLLAGCGRWPWQGQQSARLSLIGFLTTGSRESLPNFEAFVQRLREHGYVEGRSLTVEYRAAEFDNSRLP